MYLKHITRKLISVQFNLRFSMQELYLKFLELYKKFSIIYNTNIFIYLVNYVYMYLYIG